MNHFKGFDLKIWSWGNRIFCSYYLTYGIGLISDLTLMTSSSPRDVINFRIFIYEMKRMKINFPAWPPFKVLFILFYKHFFPFCFFFCFTLIFGIIFWCWKGVKVGLFTPGEAFEVVAKKRIMKLKEPATKMAVLVAEELRIILFNGLAKVSFLRVTRAVRRLLLLLIHIRTFCLFF